MYILVLNSGSSSIKFKIFEQKSLRVIVQGVADAIGLDHAHIILNQTTTKLKIANHTKALETIFQKIQKEKLIKDLKAIKLIGHRVVHGGEKYTKPALINNQVIREITRLCQLAPLHNPANLEGIKACQKLLPGIKQIAVFDTAFHQSLPEIAYLYGVPTDLYRQHGLRRYGFHGTNHQYVSQEAIKLLKSRRQPTQKIVTVHLGNGCSVTAIKNGKSIDTSMGFTPLEGLIMGTRSGDIDPALIELISKIKKLSLAETTSFLNKQSGLKGISGLDSDMRTIWAAVQKKHRLATLALDLYCYRIAKYINSYVGVLGGIDALVFTAGIGEHAWYVRSRVEKYVKHLGIILDKKRNLANAQIISTPRSSAKVLIIPANEELEIARQSLKIAKL